MAPKMKYPPTPEEIKKAEKLGIMFIDLPSYQIRTQQADKNDYLKSQGLPSHNSIVEVKKAPIVAPSNNLAVDELDAYEAEVRSRNKLPRYKKGGVVKKTGLAKVHKGEVVVPAKKVKQSEKSIGAWVKSRNKKGYK